MPKALSYEQIRNIDLEFGDVIREEQKFGVDVDIIFAIKENIAQVLRCSRGLELPEARLLARHYTTKLLREIR